MITLEGLQHRLPGGNWRLCINKPMGNPSVFMLHGNVGNVVSGKAYRSTGIGLDKIGFGLGAASITKKREETGELIIIDHVAYVKPAGERFNCDIDNSSTGEILSPFISGISANAKPTRFARLQSSTGLQFADFMKHLALGDPAAMFFYHGSAFYRCLETTAIKKAPTDDVNILTPENRLKFWAPSKTVENQQALICGMAMGGMKSEPRVFYANPADTSAPAIQMHTHALNIGGQTDVGHVLNQSLIQIARLAIYDF